MLKHTQVYEVKKYTERKYSHLCVCVCVFIITVLMYSVLKDRKRK